MRKAGRTGVEDDDPWLARDKLYHFLFCFLLTIIFSRIASLVRHPFLRRHPIKFGSILSLIAGAAKEAADQLGIFPSAGASFKDAVADAIGVLLAAGILSIRCKGRSSPDPDSIPCRRALPI